MDFQTAVRTCLTQKYASFQGRAARSEYWWFVLAIVIGSVVTQLIWWPLALVFSLAILCPSLAVGWRRLQDTGRPGWYIAIPFALSLISTLLSPDMPSEEAMASGQLPSFGAMAFGGILSLISLAVFLLYIWWLTRPSDPGPNAYGPPPGASA